jgi:hypothetical protein
MCAAAFNNRYLILAYSVTIQCNLADCLILVHYLLINYCLTFVILKQYMIMRFIKACVIIILMLHTRHLFLNLLFIECDSSCLGGRQMINLPTIIIICRLLLCEVHSVTAVSLTYLITWHDVLVVVGCTMPQKVLKVTNMVNIGRSINSES